MRLALATILVTGLIAACGGTETPKDPNPGDTVGGADAGQEPAPAARNGLGDACTSAADCPATPAHDCVFLNIGDPALGYCSPVCTTAEDCQTDYEGPPSEALFCAGTNTPNTCAIGCTSDEDCPAELVCKAPPGAPMSFCATATSG